MILLLSAKASQAEMKSLVFISVHYLERKDMQILTALCFTKPRMLPGACP